MRAYSMDLRERVLHDSDAGMPAAAVASKYRVSASWVRRLKHRRAGKPAKSPRASSGTGGIRCSRPSCTRSRH